MICVDFLKDKMTLGEARRALGEMRTTIEPSHLEEVEEMLQKAEEEQQADEESSSQSQP
tara:strand:- start:7416 stop:7592 length:177 start_codon:yes stop_codon:yes gene_type:complete